MWLRSERRAERPTERSKADGFVSFFLTFTKVKCVNIYNVCSIDSKSRPNFPSAFQSQPDFTLPRMRLADGAVERVAVHPAGHADQPGPVDHHPGHAVRLPGRLPSVVGHPVVQRLALLRVRRLLPAGECSGFPRKVGIHFLFDISLIVGKYCTVCF